MEYTYNKVALCFCLKNIHKWSDWEPCDDIIISQAVVKKDNQEEFMSIEMLLQNQSIENVVVHRKKRTCQNCGKIEYELI